MRHLRSVRVAALAALLAVGALGLTACSSGAASTPGTAANSGALPSYLKPYQKALDDAAKPVTWAGPTKPAKAPTGITVGAVNCSYSVEGCKSGGQAFSAVAKALGWKAKMIIVNDPTGYGDAMQSLINQGVKAIYLGGVDQTLVPNQMKAAAARHIPVVSVGSNYNIGGPGQVIADVHGSPTVKGQLMADAAMVDHAGKVHAVFLKDAEFAEPVQVLNAVSKQFAACTKCQITQASPINFTGTIISTQLPGQVVTAVQRDPAINSIMLGFDPPATYIVPALDAAGAKTKVTMYSQLGDSAPLQLVKEGNILKYNVAASVPWGVWGSFDEIIRYLNGQPLVDENLPIQLFSSAHPDAVDKLGANDFAATYAGYEAKYKTLWGVK
ncbi:hypothetical protein AX769_07335 [Frondihabitans sp. PAMC 28766]|uniref:sugar ABC transporter substrate-binding protein n=1 Tax=Frondihabitans sp. PAMC 28766 TaxID=1795630 RepID=UPI00078EF55C|nr:substrate-binding domain-containing protein [Frondihabitans sp. PAMC 28766]AMM20009.1 hypothetical protein AX769_07335 [Frondihabitans sp. PAMC 28766]